jgi:hypothetical protein
LYVEWSVSTQSLQCSQTNEATGILAEVIKTTGVHALAFLYTKKQIALKATIIPAIEIKSAASPKTNLAGNDMRKSSSV